MFINVQPCGALLAHTRSTTLPAWQGPIARTTSCSSARRWPCRRGPPPNPPNRALFWDGLAPALGARACVIILDEIAATSLFDVLGIWLG
jgi:hypothetical protein